MESNKQPIRCFVGIIVMKEEIEKIVETEKYCLHEEFTSKHKEMLLCYKKEYLFDGNTINAYLLTGASDPLHKVSPVGSEIAFTLTYLAVKEFNPDVILNIGYTGSTGHQQLKKGSIIISQGIGSHYLRECIVPVYAEAVKGKYPVFDGSKIGQDLGFLPGVIATSDSFVASDGGVAKNEKFTCIDMEFASIAKIGYYLNKPLIALKIVSDGEDETEETRHEEFNESLKTLGEKIQHAFLKLIEYLGHKGLDALKA